MRDCIFLLADKNMEAAFTGFFTREQFHKSLGIRQFQFDPQQDIIVEAGNDSSVYTLTKICSRYHVKHLLIFPLIDCILDALAEIAKTECNVPNYIVLSRVC